MLYRALRWLSGIALRWFYRDLEISGADRIPRTGPVLLAVNHPNALVDALVAGQLTDRRLLLTAKATLFDNPVLRALFRHVGIVPLRRVSDEAKGGDAGRAVALDASRNVDAFRAVTDALRAGKAVLIFPEGKSHSEPSLAPLRSGLARMALQARYEAGAHGVRIVPVGLTFERKWSPRTRVVARVADPIDLDEWSAEPAEAPVASLTRLVEQRLREATLNFASAEEAAWVVREARILAGIFDQPRPLGAAATPFTDEVDVIRRVLRASTLLREGDDMKARADAFLARLDAMRRELDRRGMAANDLAISSAVGPGAWFVMREGAILAGTGPIALWGRINHGAPLRLARAIAVRWSRSPEDPAMYTVAVGLVLVLAAYAIQTAAITVLFGTLAGLLYLLSLPLAATWDWRFRDRLSHARQRMRTYLQYRRDPTLQRRLLDEAAWLRAEALALERLAGDGAEPVNGARIPINRTRM